MWSYEWHRIDRREPYINMYLKKIKGLTVSNSKLSLEARCSGCATEQTGIQQAWEPVCLAARLLEFSVADVQPVSGYQVSGAHFVGFQACCLPTSWRSFFLGSQVFLASQLDDASTGLLILMRKGLRKQVFLLWVASPIMQLAPFGYFNYIMIQFDLAAHSSDFGLEPATKERRLAGKNAQV